MEDKFEEAKEAVEEVVEKVEVKAEAAKVRVRPRGCGSGELIAVGLLCRIQSRRLRPRLSRIKGVNVGCKMASRPFRWTRSRERDGEALTSTC